MVYDEQTLFFLCSKLFEVMKLNGFLKKFKKKFKIVPVNLKEIDAFHITIEEYLQALITLVEELVRPKHTTSLPLSSPPSPPWPKPFEALSFCKLPLLHLTRWG